MEFSKKILIVDWIAFAVTFYLHCRGICDSSVVLGVLAECGVSTGFYYWKARGENRLKLAKSITDMFMKKYGEEVTMQLVEKIFGGE